MQTPLAQNFLPHTIPTKDIFLGLFTIFTIIVVLKPYPWSVGGFKFK